MQDYLAMGLASRLDPYQISELDSSWCTQLDTVGMQPHSREYLERSMSGNVGGRKFEWVGGQTIDHPEGIQFSGCP